MVINCVNKPGTSHTRDRSWHISSVRHSARLRQLSTLTRTLSGRRWTGAVDPKPTYLVQLKSPLRRRINGALIALHEDGTDRPDRLLDGNPFGKMLFSSLD
jgi:hypothetical protein